MPERQCSSCGALFPATLEHFYRHSRTGNLRSKCKQCHKDVTVVSKRRRKANESPEARARRQRVERERMFTYNTGLTFEQRDAMLAAQGGVCAVCRSDEPGQRGWAVDHDHACCAGTKHCGQCIRGILCNRCNTAIGLLKDDIKILQAAVDYLTQTTASAAA